MSQENIEIVRRLYEAVERDGWEGAAEFLGEDIELRGTSGGLSEGSVAHGLEDVKETFETWDAEAWDETRLTPQEFIDTGDRVVVLQHELRRGRGSGVEVESETAVIFELRGGRVIRVQGFMDQGDALEAAGLRG
jgi:ketosteroid isomerase-like protein